MSEPIRTVLVGYGHAGAVFHAPLISADPRFRLETIVVRDPVRSKVAAERYPATYLRSSLDDALSAAPDLVVVASPPETHLPLTLAALNAGAAVVLEKPAFVRPKDGAALQAAALKAGRPVVPFHNRRWDDDFLTLSALVRSGALGQVHRFTSAMERWSPVPGKRWKREATTARGGGEIFDIGTHLIDQAVTLFGDAVVASASFSGERGAAGPDALVTLRHGSGVSSTLIMSRITRTLGPRYVVAGSEATVMMTGVDPQETQLRAGVAPRSAGYGIRKGQGAMFADDKGTRHLPLLSGAYPFFYDGVADALLLGRAVPVSLAEALRTSEIIGQAMTAAHRSRVEL